MNTLITRKKFRAKDWLLEFILIGMILFFSLAAPNFFSGGNFWNILRNISFKGIIALGMTMVIIAGDIDLSVGNMVGFAGVLTAYLTQSFVSLGLDSTPGVIISMIIVIIVSYYIGRAVAAVITRFGVPAFIVTLATMSLYKGFALIITNGFPITPYPEWFNFIGSGYVGPIPTPAIIFIVALLIMMFVMKSTPFGRSIYAIGSNKESARLSGINIHKVKGKVFGITTAFAGVAGIMISSQLNVGTPQAGTAWEMDVISSVIIGGASLSGGEGTIKGTLVGCIFLGVLLNGMTLMNVNDYWQHVMRGVLIFAAVLMNIMIKGKKTKVA